mmetsp:Transcript_45670/g.108959  ORF Transcript_45670/g.108959 Transcript_45670/m.108959 type:complete len:106 (-) Transcript_45670:52-369(-)
MYRGGKGAGASEDAVEQQNEKMIGGLQSKINNLKSITIAIGDEVRDQNRALDQMQNSMGASDNLIGSTLGKMQSLYKSHGALSIVYLAGFCVAVFLAVYLLTRLR